MPPRDEVERNITVRVLATRVDAVDVDVDVADVRHSVRRCPRAEGICISKCMYVACRDYKIQICALAYNVAASGHHC